LAAKGEEVLIEGKKTKCTGGSNSQDNHSHAIHVLLFQKSSTEKKEGGSCGEKDEGGASKRVPLPSNRIIVRGEGNVGKAKGLEEVGYPRMRGDCWKGKELSSEAA